MLVSIRVRLAVGKSRSVIAQARLASIGRAGNSHLGNVARWGGQSGTLTEELARNDRPARLQPHQPDSGAGSLSLRPLVFVPIRGSPFGPRFFNKQMSCILP